MQNTLLQYMHEKNFYFYKCENKQLHGNEAPVLAPEPCSCVMVYAFVGQNIKFFLCMCQRQMHCMFAPSL